LQTSIQVISGQLGLTGDVQQLPSSGPLTNGVIFSYYDPTGDITNSVSISTNPNTTGALDGTGDGLIMVPDYVIAPVLAVRDTDAFYVKGASGCVLSWIAW
jgi:hypothetical protein